MGRVILYKDLRMGDQVQILVLPELSLCSGLGQEEKTKCQIK